VPITDVEVIQKAAPRASLIEYPANGLSFLWFTPLQDPNNPFADPRMRQAASVAVDRQALIDTLYHGRGVWGNIVPPGLGKWFLDPRSKEHGDSAKWFKQDLKAAKQLIAAAGHTNTEFKFLYAKNLFGDVFEATAQTIGRMLAAAGFKITVVGVDYLSTFFYPQGGAVTHMVFKGAPPNSIVYDLQSPFTDPDGYLVGMLAAAGIRNVDDVSDPELTVLLRKQEIELDENKRLQLVYDVQRAHAEQMYYPPIITAKAYSFTQPWVQNYFLADDFNVGTESMAYMSVNNR
jgi:ABC-type transport system substrate-binding protein